MSQTQWEQWHKQQSDKMLVDITRLDGFIERNKSLKTPRDLTTEDLARLQGWTKSCLQYMRGNVEVQQNLGKQVEQNRSQTAAELRTLIGRVFALENDLKAVKGDTKQTLNEIKSLIKTFTDRWTPTLERLERWTPMFEELERERSHLNRTGSQLHP